MTTNSLLQLAEQAETATGPDRNIDLCIMRYAMNIGGAPENAAPYTASLDAAMSLVPEGCGWLAGYGRTRPGEPLGGALITLKAAPEHPSEANETIAEAEAATPALALTAASLRARAVMVTP